MRPLCYSKIVLYIFLLCMHKIIQIFHYFCHTGRYFAQLTECFEIGSADKMHIVNCDFDCLCSGNACKSEVDCGLIMEYRKYYIATFRLLVQFLGPPAILQITVIFCPLYSLQFKYTAFSFMSVITCIH